MKEKMIREWLRAWYNREWDGFEDIFSNDVFYCESWGPYYLGIEQVRNWFNSWHKKAKLIKWDAHKFTHVGNITFVEWSFACIDEEGTHSFDGLSVIEWDEDGKILSFKEFRSDLPHFNDYEESFY